jgi:hypothetical protein
VRVSTFSRSPTLMNSGTWITAPVSRVAGLLPPDCRAGRAGQGTHEALGVTSLQA